MRISLRITVKYLFCVVFVFLCVTLVSEAAPSWTSRFSQQATRGSVRCSSSQQQRCCSGQKSPYPRLPCRSRNCSGGTGSHGPCRSFRWCRCSDESLRHNSTSSISPRVPQRQHQRQEQERYQQQQQFDQRQQRQNQPRVFTGRCSRQRDICQQLCVNIASFRFRCHCRSGYSLQPDSKSCGRSINSTLQWRPGQNSSSSAHSWSPRHRTRRLIFDSVYSNLRSVEKGDHKDLDKATDRGKTIPVLNNAYFKHLKDAGQNTQFLTKNEDKSLPDLFSAHKSKMLDMDKYLQDKDNVKPNYTADYIFNTDNYEKGKDVQNGDGMMMISSNNMINSDERLYTDSDNLKTRQNEDILTTKHDDIFTDIYAYKDNSYTLADKQESNLKTLAPSKSSFIGEKLMENEKKHQDLNNNFIPKKTDLGKESAEDKNYQDFINKLNSMKGKSKQQKLKYVMADQALSKYLNHLPSVRPTNNNNINKKRTHVNTLNTENKTSQGLDEFKKPDPMVQLFNKTNVTSIAAGSVEKSQYAYNKHHMSELLNMVHKNISTESKPDEISNGNKKGKINKNIRLTKVKENKLKQYILNLKKAGAANKTENIRRLFANLPAKKLGPKKRHKSSFNSKMKQNAKLNMSEENNFKQFKSQKYVIEAQHMEKTANDEINAPPVLEETVSLTEKENYSQRLSKSHSTNAETKYLPFGKGKHSPLETHTFSTVEKEKYTQPEKDKYIPVQKEKYIPEGKEKYAPLEKEKYTPPEKEKYTPLEKEKYIPVEKEKYIPLEKEKYIPVEKEKYAQTKKEKYTPVEKEKYIPVEKEKYTPLEKEKYSPTEKAKYTPQEKEKYTPLEKEKYIPLEKEKYIPVEIDKYNLLENEKYIPVEKEKHTPLENEKYIPGEKEKYIPMEKEKNTPMEKEKYIPLEIEKYAPLEKQKYSPLEKEEYTSLEKEEYTPLEKEKYNALKKDKYGTHL